MDTTRTFSEYFSPNSAIAPVFLASSMFMIFVTTGRFAWISLFTSTSVFAISSAVMASKCVKSKRSLSGVTREPFCSTWFPSTVLSAFCSRCVALWFLQVSALSSGATSSVTLSPTLNMPFVTYPTCPILPPSSLIVSSTLNSASAVRITPVSPSCPPIVA